MEHQSQDLPPPAPPPRPAPAPDVRNSWRSEELLGEEHEALILHNDVVYRLRRTRQGKLILYK